jgi:hypothetical protein
MFSSPSLHRLTGRIVTAVVLALHVGVLGVAPLAEAFARANRGEQAHVEPDGSRGCPPGHNDLYCQICRVLIGTGPAPAAQRLASGGTPVIRVPVESPEVTCPTQRLISVLRARAPPTA